MGSQWTACKAYYKDVRDRRGEVYRRQCTQCGKLMRLSTSATNRFKHSLKHHAIKQKVLEAYELTKQQHIDEENSDSENEIEVFESKRNQSESHQSKGNDEVLALNSFSLSAETAQTAEASLTLMNQSNNQLINQSSNQVIK